MAKEIKFTDEEMKEISKFQQTYTGIQNTFGQIGMSRMRLQNELESLDNVEQSIIERYANTQGEEKKFVEDITKKYGDGQLNIDTGTFVPKTTENSPQEK